MNRMLHRVSPVDLLAAVVERVTDGTSYPCMSDPDMAESPFYSLELVESRPERSKTMYLDTYVVWVHVIAAPSKTQETVLDMVQELEEAMTQPVELPDCFNLTRQVESGMQTINKDPTGEWHAVVAYELTVSYGLMVK